MKKIAILGAGNAGCLTALHYYYYGKDMFEITIYHDPDTPIERVGQGTTLRVATLISKLFDLNLAERNLIQATRKEGILYENWGKKKSKIYHSFPISLGAIHYSPHLLSTLILESGLFKVEHKKVKNPESEIDSDYIFDCRGRHGRDASKYDTLINPINSAILSRSDRMSDSKFTGTIATPNGWTFVIPNHDSTSYGYLYNSDITTKKDAKKDFMQRFDVIPDGYLSFQNYLAKNCFVGERTILNGNKLSFLEPLEATSTDLYLYMCRISWDHITNGIDKSLCNEAIRAQVFKLQKYILWHYQFGSAYDTPFWEYAKSLPFETDAEFDGYLQIAKNNTFAEIQRIYADIEYAQWPVYSFKNWIENV